LRIVHQAGIARELTGDLGMLVQIAIVEAAHPTRGGSHLFDSGERWRAIGWNPELARDLLRRALAQG
jgi:hypothetical protein